jgi:hypothetical protein
MNLISKINNAIITASIRPPAGVPDNLTISELVAGAIRFAYVIIGIIFFAMVVFAGFTYLTSEGNPDKTKQAMSILVYAFVGAGIALAAGAITGIFESVFGIRFQ